MTAGEVTYWLGIGFVLGVGIVAVGLVVVYLGFWLIDKIKAILERENK